MEKITGNEVANPKIETYFDFADSNNEKVYGNTFSDGGMTIRQEFAIRCLQGILSEGSSESHLVDKAIRAVRSADFLIKALNETPNPNETKP